MISYETYKILHFFGIALLLLGLGSILGSYAVTANVKGKAKMAGFIAHGLGLLLALTGGFGMAARLGLVNGLPGWIYGKLAIWVILGIGISLSKRKAQWGTFLFLIYAGLVGVASWLAITKPI